MVWSKVSLHGSQWCSNYQRHVEAQATGTGGHFRRLISIKKEAFSKHTIPPSVLKSDNDSVMMAYCTYLRHTGPQEGEGRKSLSNVVFFGEIIKFTCFSAYFIFLRIRKLIWRAFYSPKENLAQLKQNKNKLRRRFAGSSKNHRRTLKSYIRACLHLVTLCVFSNQISIWFVKMFPFTIGHINVSLQNGYKSVLQFPLYMQI